METWSRTLETWHDFYVFSGTVAATVMGLMFVVMSLGQRTLGTERGVKVTRAFFTPIVVFFSTIIVIAVFMLMPMSASGGLGLVLGALSLGGLIYMFASGAHTVWRTSELGYDDLIWYVVLPYVNYAVVGIAALLTFAAHDVGLFVLAGAMLSFLLTGIRNAWDLVVFSIQRGDEDQD